jgi:hypothetical protein
MVLSLRHSRPAAAGRKTAVASIKVLIHFEDTFFICSTS